MKHKRAIIIDDEISASNLLIELLKAKHPEIQILANCQNVDDGTTCIDKMEPEIVFLDVDLVEGLGFDILEQVNFRDFDVVFTTAFAEYAVQAFEFSALHYLIKPIAAEKLQTAIKRFEEKNAHPSIENNINKLKDLLHSKPRKILIPTGNGLELFNIDDIVRCEADGNYTNIYFNTKKHILVSKTLQAFETSLIEFNFIRVNRKFLINIDNVIRFNRGKTPTITLVDGFEVAISDNYLQEFKELFNSNIAKLA